MLAVVPPEFWEYAMFLSADLPCAAMMNKQNKH